MNIGERIKEIRLKKGMKQSELANMIEVSRMTITNIENGKHKETFDLIEPLCKALEITPNYLIMGKEEAKENNLNLNEEGIKLYYEYLEYLEQKYPKNYKQVGNL